MYQYQTGQHSFSALFSLISKEEILRIFSECFSRHLAGDQNVNAQGFLAGKPCHLSLDQIKQMHEYQEIAELYSFLDKEGISLRLNNVHTIGGPIQDYVREEFKKSTVALTCNLYLTPPSGECCLALHSDIQKSKVLQICGKKKWLFPLGPSGETVKSFDRQKILKLSKDPKGKETSLEMLPGNLLEFSQGAIHKTEIFGDEVSIHLTFAQRPLFGKDILDSLCLKLSAKFEEAGLGIKSLETQEERDDAQSKIESILADIDIKELIVEGQRHRDSLGLAGLKKGRGKSYN